MIKDALYAVTHGQDLSYDLAKDTMNKIMSGDVAEVPMAGFLCALAAKGPTVDEVTAFAEVMREKAGSVPHEGTVVEIVGTGGEDVYKRQIPPSPKPCKKRINPSTYTEST